MGKVVKKERREFYGIRDKVDHGLMTKEDARAGKKPKVVLSETRLTANAADLAADYKAKGIDRQATYSEFVRDRALKPEMDAKEFFAIYDQVTPRLITGQAKPLPKPAPEVETKLGKGEKLSFEDWKANQPAGDRNNWIRVRLIEKGIPTKPTSNSGKIKFQNEARKAREEFDRNLEKTYRQIIE